MYNEEVKQRYFNQIRNKSTCHSASIALSKVEEHLNDDIAKSFRTEIINALENCDYISYSTLRTELYIINDYINWYNKHIEVTNVSIIKNITSGEVDLSKSIRKNIFFSPEEVKNSTRFWPAKEGYFVPVVAYLYFLGFNNTEIINLKKSDVYEENGKVYVTSNKKTVVVDEDFIAKDLIAYSKVKNATREHMGTWIVYSIETGKYIRNFYTFDRKNKCPVSAMTLRSKFTECNKLLGSDYKNITERVLDCSGRLYRVMQEEERTGDYKEALNREFKQRGYDNEILYLTYKIAQIKQ